MPLISTPELDPESQEFVIDKEFNWTARRSFWCYFTPGTDEVTAYKNLGSGLSMFAQHPNDDQLVITALNVRRNASVLQHPDSDEECVCYIADASYSAWTPLLAVETGNPLQAYPNFIFRSERTEEVCDTDINDEPIVNSVGDPYNPPLMKRVTRYQFVVTANLADPNWKVLLFDKADRVNATQWGPFPPRSLLIAEINGNDRLYSQVARQLYYRVEFVFDIAPNTHDAILANLGYREFWEDDGGNVVLRNIVIDGQPATDPVIISNEGAYLEPPVAKEDIPYHTYKIYKEIDFADLGIDRVFQSDNFPHA